MKKVLRDTTEYVPFAIIPGKRGGDSKHWVEVLDPGQAARLRDELDTTHDKFEPHKSSLVQVSDRICEKKNKL